MKPSQTHLASSAADIGTVLIGWIPVAVSIFFLLTMALMWRSTRRHLENSLPPGLRQGYRPGRLVRFLVFCAGAHPADLARLSPGRHAAHAVAGMLIFVPAAMAFLGIRMWLAEFLPDQTVAQSAWALAGATLVFMVDLGCVWAIGGLRGRSIVTGVLPRVALAVLIGFFLAKPFLVVIYKDEIAAMQREKKKAEVFGVVEKMQEQRQQVAEQHQPVIARFREAKVEVQRRVDALQPRRREVQGRHDELHRSYVTEVTQGQNGRPDGEGKYAKFIKQELDKVRAELDTIDAEERAMKAELEQLAKDEEETVSRVFDDPKFSETQTAFDTLMREAHQSGAASIGRQLDLVREYVAVGDRSRKLEYWFWHLLFWCLDTIPITMKLAMRRWDVAMLQEKAEQRLEAEVAAEVEDIGMFAKEKAQALRESELRRLWIGSLIEDIELLYLGASHTVLRGLQYEINLRETYSAMMKRMPEESVGRESDWNRALAPLRRVQEQVLHKFAYVIDGYGARRGATPGTGEPSEVEDPGSDQPKTDDPGGPNGAPSNWNFLKGNSRE